MGGNTEAEVEIPVTQGVPVNGQPAGGGVSMNGQPAYQTDGSPTAYATPVPPGADAAPAAAGAAPPSMPYYEQQKLGAKCCGCCCDYRRACIIVDGIYMALSAFALLSLAFPTSTESWELQQLGIDDDQVIEVYDESATVTSIVNGCGLLFYAVPLYGAMMFNIPMLSYGIFWMIANYIAQVIIGVIYTGKAKDAMEAAGEDTQVVFGNYIIAAIFTGLVIYPHAGLILEISRGIMSKETYPREEYSCCCTGR